LPIIPDSALQGVQSPQTIYQSAVNGVPISGMPPTDDVKVQGVQLRRGGASFNVAAGSAGTVHAYLWSGEHGMIPVFESSCPDDQDGFNACSPDDGAAPPWGTDMGGHVVADGSADVSAGRQRVTLPLGAQDFDVLRANGSLLVSYESAAGEVAAWYVPLARGFEGAVLNAPAVNEVKAGSTVAVKLVDDGLTRLAAGYPRVTPVVCGLNAPTAGATETTGALRDDVYEWRTDAARAGSCARLDLRLDDGVTHSAYFSFR
jgi:hypothetical protein